jgi:hypothetical protein
VSGNSGRLSVAGLACLKPGQPGRFFYRRHVHRGRKGERPSLGEADYAALITAVRRNLNARGRSWRQPDPGIAGRTGAVSTKKSSLALHKVLHPS